jgi:flagellar protein FlgJ
MSELLYQATAPRNLVAAAPDRPTNPNQMRARETAEDFEAVFLAQMLGHMNLGVDPDSEFGGGKGEEAFQSMMAEKYGEAISEMGGIGIADAIYKEILRMQESAA